MKKAILILSFAIFIVVCTVVNADHIRVKRECNYSNIIETFLDGHIEIRPVIDWWSGKPIEPIE